MSSTFVRHTPNLSLAAWLATRCKEQVTLLGLETEDGRTFVAQFDDPQNVFPSLIAAYQQSPEAEFDAARRSLVRIAQEQKALGKRGAR